MISIEEMTNRVIKALAEVIEENGGDLRWVVCSERAFVSDFVPKYNEDAQRVSDSADLMENEPYDGPYDQDKIDWDNTVFAVVKIGGGDINQGVMAASATITVLSCNHDFQEPRNVLVDFVRAVNFEYINGMVQSYFPPSISQSMAEVYDGFRALINVTGTIKVPTNQDLLFVTNLYYTPASVKASEISGDLYVKNGQTFQVATVADNTELVGNETKYYKLDKNGIYVPAYYMNVNFITYSFQDSKSQDPQGFLNDSFGGITQNVNRQGTIVLSFSTYFFIGDGFTEFVHESITNQNKFTKVAVRCSGSNSDGSAYFWYEGDMSVTGHSASGEWGDMNLFTVSMTSGRDIFNG